MVGGRRGALSTPPLPVLGARLVLINPPGVGWVGSQLAPKAGYVSRLEVCQHRPEVVASLAPHECGGVGELKEAAF